MFLRSLFLTVLVPIVLASSAQEREIIINEEIGIMCFQVKDGDAVLPDLKKNDVDEIFVSVPAFRGRCEIDVRLIDETGTEIAVMDRRKRNDAIGLTFDSGKGDNIQVVVFSECKKMVMLNTVNGLVNISGRNIVGRINVRVK